MAGLSVQIVSSGTGAAERFLLSRHFSISHGDRTDVGWRECPYDVITNVIMSAMKKLKITPVGNSACVILPKETLAKLRVDRGDNLYMTDTANGIELSPYNPEFARQMEVARQVMAENRDVLRKLAK